MARWLIPSSLLTVAVLAAALYVCLIRPDLLPANVPVHWNINMQPDHFVPREGVVGYFLIFPGVMALAVIVCLALPRLSPKTFETPGFSTLFARIMTLVVVFMAYLFTLVMLVSMGDFPLFGKFFMAGFFLLFGALGAMMMNVKRNSFMGVRTPWTLASDVVWTRTHRLTGYMWIAMGIVGFVASIVGVPVWMEMVGLMIGIFYPIIYSLVIYRQLKGVGGL